ncbi:flagellar biosynthesis protein FlhF [Paenibacillus sp. N1-5-1-14]|uniref:flagellar biosynthesis protein FlhF n=1 Tax=Paenibacillus radicibacter TaxID=2972488 RepID=UPI00215977FF|nr:flagellar biosynthesis protein FlhF [Paenibacillus radicibacter]MCR8642174.1 flagellar biosynthesis protein FlhF [Paenibacillus radicibacter]
MRVKRYVVDSMPDALHKIRSELGNDAVILNTKEVRLGGFLGFFAKKKIEVVAAIDESASKTNAAEQAAANAFMAMVPQIKTQPIVPPVIIPESRLAAEAPIVPPLVRAPSISVQTNDRATFPIATPVAAPAVEQVDSSRKRAEDQLLTEIKLMKEMMSKLALSNQSGGQAIQPEIVKWYENRLTDQEISSEIVQDLLQHAIEESRTAEVELSNDFIRESLTKQLKAIFQKGNQSTLHPQTRIVHFVGPTGVGKTTTIAKLAAEQVLKDRRKVGFITSDTYRIAAIEQLKTYANILNVPIEVVFSPQDLNKAFTSLHDVDVIFMDTAGRNYRNEMYVSELHALLQSEGQSETYLVLSLTTKYRDMKVIIDHFSKFKLDKVLLTKMDETDSYGCIVNIVHEFGLTISYMTDGQNVPDDIILFNEDKLIDLILGEYSGE